VDDVHLNVENVTENASEYRANRPRFPGDPDAVPASVETVGADVDGLEAVAEERGPGEG